MPRKGVTRGDLIVGLAAVGVLVFSFLPWYTVEAEGSGLNGGTVHYSAWISDFLPLAPAVVLLSAISLVLLIVGRYTIRAGATQPTEVQFAGLSFRQWGVAFGVAAAWSGVWALFGADGGYEKLADEAVTIARARGGTAVIEAGHGWASWALVGCVLLQALLLLTGDRIAGLDTPLVNKRPGTWQGYPGGGFPGAPGGYPPGPPGTGGFVVPPPAAPPAYGSSSGNTPPPRTPPTGQPPAVQPPVLYRADTPAGGQRTPVAPQSMYAPVDIATDPGTFEQYWLAVPQPRDLRPFDDDGREAVATLHPGVWYLAVGRHGDAIVIDIDGLQGVLRDLTGIQRGE